MSDSGKQIGDCRHGFVPKYCLNCLWAKVEELEAIIVKLPALRIRSRCPMCGNDTLFLDARGYLVCSWLECKEPVLDTAVEKLQAEVKRLRWRLNHQTEDDVWNCQHGKHGKDCGA